MGFYLVAIDDPHGRNVEAASAALVRAEGPEQALRTAAEVFCPDFPLTVTPVAAEGPAEVILTDAFDG